MRGSFSRNESPVREDRCPFLHEVGITLIVIPLLSACASRVPPGLLTDGNRIVKTCPDHDSATVRLTYLGAGGVFLERGDDTILTAPFFSNPRICRVALGCSIRPNVERINGRLDEYLPDVEAVDAILVGHAHYDHLMDLPYIVEHRLREGTIYGSETMGHMIASSVPANRLQTVNDFAGDREHAGKWVPAGKDWRIMALKSSHAPHFLGIRLFKGSLSKDRPRLPRSGYGWKEGQTFAFLIDFLAESSVGPTNDGSATGGVTSGVFSETAPQVDFRVHYQDAASRPPSGFPPTGVLGERRVDVAIVTVAGFGQTKEYPEGIIQELKPRHVVLVHWEDFFRDPEKPPKVLRATNLKRFIRRLERVLPSDADWTMAKPGVELEFNVCAGGEAISIEGAEATTQ